MAAEQRTAAWQAALQDACNVLSDLDESDLRDTTDFEGKANFHLVEILMQQMAGRRVPFEDRASISDQWRPVMIVPNARDSKAELLLASGDVADEHDTPGGELPLYEGTNSLQSEYGLYYRLPRPLLEMLEVEQSDEEDEEDEESGAASIDPGAAEKTAVEPEGELPTCEIVDKMRVMYKEKAMTVRTRDGTGDSAIAGTKVRLLGMEPGYFEMPLRADLVAGMQSGEVKVLSADEDPEDDSEHPADVLRSDKHVTGTLYAQLDWPFAGVPPAFRPPRPPALRTAVPVLVRADVPDVPDVQHWLRQASDSMRPRCSARCSSSQCRGSSPAARK